MIPSRTQDLTNQFYEWEQLGRGWMLFDYPVDLEPPFYQFYFHGSATPYKPIDDGLHPTLLGKVKNLFNRQDKIEIRDPFTVIPVQDEELEPVLTTFQLLCPKDYRIGVEEMERLLLMFSFSKHQISFEIIATSESIQLQFVCREVDGFLLQSQLKAYFPKVVVTRTSIVDPLILEDMHTYAFDFGMGEEFMRPLAISRSLEPDPYTGLIGFLDHLEDEDRVIIQILFKGTESPWSESILRSVMDNTGEAFFLDAPEMLPLAKEKVSHPLFATTIRLITQSQDDLRALNLTRSIGQSVCHISDAPSNRLIPLSVDSYDPQEREADIILRQTHRLGMLLNSRELVNLIHLPSPSIHSIKLVRDIRKTKQAPKNTDNHDFILGGNIHEGKEKLVSIESSQRLRHLHIIGATGTGKSTLLLNLIAQDIQLGNGIACLDPHGDLIENILDTIPENRIQDVVIIDPADSEFPVGFNILKAHTDIEKEILSSDLVAAFKRLSTSWGDQMNSVFANAILAFLESSVGGTLLDLRRFLIEKPFRDSYLKTVTDSHVIYYWQKEFPILKSTSIGPILTRLDTFLRPKLIRNMVAQKKSIDFEDILDNKKILLVKLSQGLIGNENSYLLGTFIVSKIQQAAMARQVRAKETRTDFFLYIDEFQNFITPSMSAILSGARKYHLGLILAHQDMQQLVKYDSELASSVVANAGTRICFRLGDTDAKKFESGFSYFDAKDLQSLNVGEAIARIVKPDYDFNLTISQSERVGHYSYKDQIINHSRIKFGSEKRRVEETLHVQAETHEEVVPDENVQKEKQKTSAENSKVTISASPATPEQLTKTKEKLVEQNEESDHRYLQLLIKKMAESRGFKATIEQPTPDGKGRVDVLLERNKKSIACEITITTTENWEVHNIEKCLSAGYNTIVVCAQTMSSLEKIRKKCVAKITDFDQEKILFFEPQALFQYLDQYVAAESSSEKRYKGYRVEVKYAAVGVEEAKQKKDSILKAVTEAFRKKGDGKI